MKKVPASEATRKRLEEVFRGEHIDPSRIVREAARLMIEKPWRRRSKRRWAGSTTLTASRSRTMGRGRCATAFAAAAAYSDEVDR